MALSYLHRITNSYIIQKGQTDRQTFDTGLIRETYTYTQSMILGTSDKKDLKVTLYDYVLVMALIKESARTWPQAFELLRADRKTGFCAVFFNKAT